MNGDTDEKNLGDYECEVMVTDSNSAND